MRNSTITKIDPMSFKMTQNPSLMYLISTLNRCKLLNGKFSSFRSKLGVIFDFSFQFSISISKFNFQFHFKVDLSKYKIIKVPNAFKLLFRSKCLGFVEALFGVFVLSSNNYGEIYFLHNWLSKYWEFTTILAWKLIFCSKV